MINTSSKNLEDVKSGSMSSGQMNNAVSRVLNLRVFLSWSGKKSRKIAEVLSIWLRQIINAVDPWISSEMEKGIRWGSEIAHRLEESKVGIICLTRENLNENWILFEAGALSKTKDVHVCTFLFDITPADIKQPLAQFQHTQFKKEDVRKLVHTISQKVKKAGEQSLPEKDLNDLFDILWPRLEERLQKVAEEQEEVIHPIRSDREILEEILMFVRVQQRSESPFFVSREKGREELEELYEEYRQRREQVLLELVRKKIQEKGEHLNSEG